MAKVATASATRVTVALWLVGVVAPGAWAAEGVLDPARSQAPYFAVDGEGGTESLPLEETSAEVDIAGVIARVRVHQRYRNTGKKAIEAVYVFPASTRAAVHGMRMKIGERVIEAHIDKRAAARAEYQAARQQGKRASLLEQQRPNVFTMNVANVMPGDRIAVELDYTEMLVPEESIYEFVYPTVVGPRYPGGADPKRDGWIANPYLREGQAEPYRFDIKVNIGTGIALKDLASPSHPIDVKYDGAARAGVRLKTPGGGNRDFILRYRLADERIQSGVLLWEGKGSAAAGKDGAREQFFAVMMEPPVRPAASQTPPREYIFLLDVSGSMHGFPLDTAKALMARLLEQLRPMDRFNVVLFSGSSHTLHPGGSLPASPGNIAQAWKVIEQQRGGGGTELQGGLEACYRIPQRDRNVSRSLVVITDGFVGVEAQTYRLIRERLDQANVFAFGIGTSVNRALIEGMARAGVSEPFIVLSPAKADAEAAKLKRYIEQPVLTEVQVKFDGFAAEEVAPAKLPDLMARRPLVLFGKYRGPAGGRIEVSGVNAAGRFHQTLQVRPDNAREDNRALRWLWARKRVELLDDERALAGGAAAEQAITRLGLDYSMMTAFTSFVAVDSQVVNRGGKGSTVAQPLPLPEGVSDLAVGASAGASLGRAYGMQGIIGTGSGGGGGPALRKKSKVDDDPLGGLSLSGKAGGSASPAPASTPSLAPPPAPVAVAEAAPPPADKPARVSEERASSRRPRATASAASPAPRKDAPAPRLELVRAQFVTDPHLVLESVTALLRKPGCGTAAPRGLRLRITVDAAGKVVAVARLDGEWGNLRCLEQALLQAVTGTHARGKAAGTVEVRLAAP